MEYRGYNAVVTYDYDVRILHGQVIDTRDVITFEGKSVDELDQAFKDSIDDYLKFCQERGREPDKPFSGRVALRMEPDTHRAIVGAARASGKSLNTWIIDAIANELNRADDGDGMGPELAWDVDQNAMESFHAFLQEAWARRSLQESISPFISMWADPQGRVWASDARPAHEIFRFYEDVPGVTSEESRLV